MKTKALDLPAAVVAITLMVGACLYLLMNRANAEGSVAASPVVQVVQDNGALSEAELMLLVHRSELPQAAGPGTTR